MRKISTVTITLDPLKNGYCNDCKHRCGDKDEYYQCTMNSYLNCKQVKICPYHKNYDKEELEKRVNVVCEYFKDKNNNFGYVDFQAVSFDENSVYFLFDLPYTSTEYCLDANLSANGMINTLLEHIISNLESMESTISKHISHLKSKKGVKDDE